MDQQQFFNIAVAIIGVLGGWWMRVMWQSLKELQAADSKLADKVSSVEVLVAGKYVMREELSRDISAIFSKLDRIEDKLDKKVDKGAVT
ncbi:hypothetical protein KL1_0001 [Burkholderia phage vB_BceS_KL1]|uniref:Uncharacterized protein n=1 Tax=Burkholderia phage vB_BceS_KL1 TaxID=1132026 RepID=I6NMA1_9CAUD|nr:lipoprotein [Burkholderia phage vB_BceS_KL1]AEX56087.1 hypothetical protein KL1_0001 [Burkholderia phage vB_BceS_KL1]